MTTRTSHVLLLASALLGLCCAVAHADDTTREYQIKAAFIYNFAQFTEWPDSAFSGSGDPFVVAVIGQNPFGTSLEQIMNGKTIAGRSVVVKYIDTPDQITGCNLLYVAATEDDNLDAIFKVVADKPILTVGDSDKFPWAGGIIRFLIEDNKIRFEISPDSADKAGLRISSKLMSLAKIFKR
jgi:uncharacterized protein DUF4154